VQVQRPQAYEKERKPESLRDNPKLWKGWVDVSAELFSILPPHLIATETKEKECYGETGRSIAPVFFGPIPIPVPYDYDTYKRSEGRALVQAAHRAIAGLLRKRRGGGWAE